MIKRTRRRGGVKGGRGRESRKCEIGFEMGKKNNRLWKLPRRRRRGRRRPSRVRSSRVLYTVYAQYGHRFGVV